MSTCSIHLTDIFHQTDEYWMTWLQNLEIIIMFIHLLLIKLCSEARHRVNFIKAMKQRIILKPFQTLTRHDLRTIFSGDVWVVWVAVTNWTGYQVLDQNVATSSSVSGFWMKPCVQCEQCPGQSSIGQAVSRPPTPVTRGHEQLVSWKWFSVTRSFPDPEEEGSHTPPEWAIQ